MKRGFCMTVVLAAGMLAAACTSGTEEKAQSTKAAVVGSGPVKVEVFAKKACGATVPTIELVKSTLAEMKVPHDLQVIYVNSHNRARELKVPGSPTVRVNGIDIEPGAAGKQNYGITWRKYGVSEIPPKELLVAALEKVR